MLINIILLFTMLLNVAESTIYDYKIKALDSDKVIDLSSFKGKKILVVNVASKCGYTPQYEDLQKLSTMYADKLVVIGFPCDQFGGQELDTELEIKQFCSGTYHVTFPVTTVVEVKGENQHPVYQWLTKKSLNGIGDYEISWNFNKFLIDENGKFLKYFPSKVKPMDESILKYLN